MTITYADIRSSIDMGDIVSPDVNRGHEYRHQGVLYTYTAHDDCSTIMDEQGEGVWCGQLVWAHERNAYGYVRRPDGFDGNAEVIDRDRGSQLWWQPMEDCTPGSDIRASVRRTINDLREYGYIGIEVSGGGQTEALWMIGATEYEYHKEVVADLITECYALKLLADADRADYLRYYAPDLERWLNY